MANYYVRSAAAGSGTGADWTNAYTTISAAVSGKAAGDIFYVADDHAETQASSMTIASPGTVSSPCLIMCVNTHTTTPPTGLATSATCAATGGSSITFTGFLYGYGITFQAGLGSGLSAVGITMNTTTTGSYGFTFESCKLQLLGTHTGIRITMGSAPASGIRDSYIELINTPVKFSATGQGIANGLARMFWRDTASAVDSGGSIPTTLFFPTSSNGHIIDLHNVDFSALGSGKYLVNASNSGSAATYHFRNCKLGSSVSVINGNITTQSGVRVFLENCDSADTNYRMEHYKYQGSIIQETTIVKSGGASDGTTSFSRKMISLSGSSFIAPLESPPIYMWNDSTGSSKTVTVDIIHDSATSLKDDEVWVEVEYLGTSGFPIGSSISDRKTDYFSSASNQSTSSATWTTTGMTNPNKQKLEVTFTPQEKGYIRAKVCLAKASYTVYYDTKLIIS